MIGRILKKIGRPVFLIIKKAKWLILTMAMIGLSVGCVWFYDDYLADLPNINQIYYPPSLSSKILDSKGRLLYKFFEQENRSWIPLEKIPESLVWATVAIEDKEFFKHKGLSVKGITQAVIHNLRKDGENLRGGSTISQQLVKNIFFSNEKTFKRKIREAVLTLILESRLSKEEILERYFNQVAYGGNIYGVQEAALKYFGKNVWQLNMAESAFLAGLPAAPSWYSPLGQYPNFAYVRQKRVIEEMHKAGFIDEKRMIELMEEPIEVKTEGWQIEAPHFVFWIKEIMEEKYGFENFDRQGLTIITSLDLDTQRMAEEVVKKETEKIKALRISNGAALVVDVRTGDVVAMVGSKDYHAPDIDGKFNVTTALRQPGSAIKPINYLLALKNGMTLMSTVDDTPKTYYVPGQRPYSPQNYNGKYMGRVNLKTALASSLNVPSVKLLEKNGVDNMIDLAEEMGINTWKDRSRFGLSLALGAGEVKMVELAQAYSVFANLGRKVEINPILRIDNYLGETVWVREEEVEEVIEPEYAFLINEILSDNQARAPIFGTKSKLVIDNKKVAVKTGTTNNLKDNWCIGWTPSVLVATWVGNNDSSPMSWVASGVTGATPIWHDLMSQMLVNRANEDWIVPSGIIKAKACGREEYFIKGTEKINDCWVGPTPTPLLND